MAGLIPQSFIDDLLNRVDIVDVVGSRIQLKKTGKNYSACCPFHHEKTPSFTVSPDKQFYHCFGCGASGSALGFIMEYEHLDFPQAVEVLAKQVGVEIPYEEGTRGRSNKQATESPLYALLGKAAEFYQQALKTHPTKQIAVQKLLIDAGLVIENADNGRRYDRFRDRVMFPIRDMKGRVIAFGGRVLGDDKPKYLNSPETPVFHKGEVLYGLYEVRKNARQLDEVLVLEGYMDVIALAQYGLINAVATLGTATSEEHIKRLFRVVANILFCFDGDVAGRKAAWRALESALPLLQDGRRIRFLFLPEGEDPDSLVRKEGADAFRARASQQALSLTDYFFDHLMQEAKPDTLEGKAHLAALASPLLAKMPKGGLQTLMYQRLEDITGLTQSHLAEAVIKVQQQAAHVPYSEVTSLPTNNTEKFSQKAKKQVITPVMRALRYLLHKPALIQKVAQVESLRTIKGDYGQLLLKALELLQKEPTLNSFQLMGKLASYDNKKLLTELVDKEQLIENENNLEKEFIDTI